MGWKKLIFGEKMPDRDDPKYEKRYQKEVEAGKKAARFLRIDKMAGCGWGCAGLPRGVCLCGVWGRVWGGPALSVCGGVPGGTRPERGKRTPATERQEILLKQKQPTHDDDGQN